MNVKEVTLKSIAERLDISPYSVSRALSGKEGVSEETRQLVLNLAHELGYKHPAITRVRENGSNVMLLIPQDSAYSSEFWINVISGAEEEAERLGFNLITRPLATDARKPLGRQIHGVIGVGHRSREIIKSLVNGNVPVTLITHPLPLEEFDTVTTRNWEGGFVVGQHLIRLGHKHMMFVADITGELTREERARGLKDAVKELPEVQVDALHLHLENLSAEFEKAYAAALAKGNYPTAIFCALDVIAFNVIWALNRLGLKVPQDVSVVGFTDVVQASQFFPKLTTVRSPMRHLGIAAMQNLYRQMEAKGTGGPARHLSIAPELIIRESTAPPPQRS